MTKSGAALVLVLLLAGCSTTGINPEPRTAIIAPDSFYFAPADTAMSATPFAALLPIDDSAFKMLMRRAEQAPSLELALARVDAARAVSARAAAERKPSLDVGLSTEGARTNPNQLGSLPAGISADRTRFDIGGTVSARWDLDIFGRLRNSENAAQRRFDAVGFDAQAVRIAIMAEVAAGVIDWQNIIAQQAVVDASIASAEDRAQLIDSRVRAGLNPALDSMRAEALVAGLRAQLPPLKGEETAIVGRMVALTGAPAEQIISDLNQSRIQWISNANTTAAPSAIIAARPDIQAAAARLAASDSDLAATAAKRFPRVTLSSALGLLAFSLGGIFSTDAITGQLAADLAGPLLDFGRIEAEIKQSQAQSRIAFAELRRSTYMALGEVEEAFGRLAASDREVALLAQQSARKTDVAHVTASRYRAGLESFIQVLEDDSSAYTASQAAIAARGRAARARLTLWQSLGGPQ